MKKVILIFAVFLFSCGSAKFTPHKTHWGEYVSGKIIRHRKFMAVFSSPENKNDTVTYSGTSKARIFKRGKRYKIEIDTAYNYAKIYRR